MPGTVSDLVVQRLRTWGVTRIYGYPGDGINGLMGALRRAEGEIELRRYQEDGRALVLQRLRRMGVDLIEAPWDRISYRLIDRYLEIKRAESIG